MAKKRRNPGKGSAFEREICKKLSLWWTHGNRDDVFWRTSNSGGRATIRAKGEQKTFGQYGDIQATDPIGQQLLDRFTIECKTGYPGQTITDEIDKITSGQTQYEKFIEQAVHETLQAGSTYWMLITRRKGKEILLTVPEAVAQDLCPPELSLEPCLYFYGMERGYFVTHLDTFLDNISPEDIRHLHR